MVTAVARGATEEGFGSDLGEMEEWGRSSRPGSVYPGRATASDGLQRPHFLAVASRCKPPSLNEACFVVSRPRSG